MSVPKGTGKSIIPEGAAMGRMKSQSRELVEFAGESSRGFT
jgi:hypothetical protein